jgi:hypothetical protein
MVVSFGPFLFFLPPTQKFWKARAKNQGMRSLFFGLGVRQKKKKTLPLPTMSQPSMSYQFSFSPARPKKRSRCYPSLDLSASSEEKLSEYDFDPPPRPPPAKRPCRDTASSSRSATPSPPPPLLAQPPVRRRPRVRKPKQATPASPPRVPGTVQFWDSVTCVLETLRDSVVVVEKSMAIFWFVKSLVSGDFRHGGFTHSSASLAGELGFELAFFKRFRDVFAKDFGAVGMEDLYGQREPSLEERVAWTRLLAARAGVFGSRDLEALALAFQ